MFPDYVIIGAMKCGTSTLAAQLGQQDGIFMTDPKEPNFFSDDNQYARGIDTYRDLFKPAASGDLLGEASTHYTKLPTYPETLPRMLQHLEQPKLIYMIRNPIPRLISHYIHEWSMGVYPDDIETSLAKHPEMIEYGRYGHQIKPYADAFGAENIHLTSLESMKKSPQCMLEDVCQFLGYKNRPMWHDEQTQMNSSAERIRKFPLHGLLFDNPVARAARRNLVPQGIRDRIKQSRQMMDRPQLSESNVARLQDIYAKDRDTLALIFPDHPILNLCYPFLSNE
ncbi:Sulfotransferase domain protein [Roseovarius albus]|uniref:Sulfotransferase domain protein n=1 Tax=Roseovarius albus TaxID=1247867 RepID=A0A1X6ZL64_9RHOB|nr:sulfotransferase domain-containing protein [Roseovarius albus]SLN54393.1 Sulfotransferase domain protein [Roseovarius albus]